MNIFPTESSSTTLTKLIGKNDKENAIVSDSFYYLTYNGTFQCSVFLISPNKVLAIGRITNPYCMKDYHLIRVVRDDEQHGINLIEPEYRRQGFENALLSIIEVSYCTQNPKSSNLTVIYVPAISDIQWS